jgi:PPOX class probable FMN-dependent enzyme
MTALEGETVFTTPEALRAALGSPVELAARKAIPRLDHYCAEFIARAPFLTLATCNRRGELDVSPRGDRPGFVLMLDQQTLFIPERPGNARYDSLLNILDHPRVGLLFFIPGFEDTLRVNGRAAVVDNPILQARCAVDGKLPRAGIRVDVEEAFLHCAKALRRGRLWDPAAQRDRGELPSLGRMILEQTAATSEAVPAALVAEVDALVEENYRTTLY